MSKLGVMGDALKLSTEAPSSINGQPILCTLEGVIADFENPTRNDRFYSKRLWEKALKSSTVQEQIANGGIMMELNHPEDRDETDLSCVAAIMPELPQVCDDGKLRAKVHVIDTPMGKIANTLARYGYKLGISSRGNGDVDTNGYVDEDTYELMCWDLVAMPSVKDARLSLVTESLHNKGTLNESLSKIVKDASDEDKKLITEKLAQLNITLTSENAGEAREVSIPVDMTVNDNGDVKIETVTTLPEDDPGIIGETPEVTVTPDVVMQAQSEVEQEVEAEVANSDVDNSVEDDNIQVSVEDEEADDVGDSLLNDLQEALKERNSLRKTNEELQSSLSVGYAKEQQLTADIERYKAKIQELVESTKVVTGLKARSTKLEESVNKLQESLTESQKAHDKLNKTVNLQSVSIRQLERLKERADKSNEEKSAKLDESAKRIEILQGEINKQRKLFESKLSEAKSSKQEEYNSRLNKVNKDNKALINENELLKTKLAKMTEAYAHSVCDMYDVDYDLISDTVKRSNPTEIKKLAESYAHKRVVESRLPFTNSSVKKINYIRPADNMTEHRYNSSDDIGYDEVETYTHYER